MPYIGSDFPNATVGEAITYFLDFTFALAPGETIVSASVTAAVAPDSEVSDPSASAIVSGPAGITGNIVGQQFTGMVFSVKYLLTYTANTNQGNVIIPFTHFFTDQPS